MISCTKAFTTFRSLSQAHLNFVVFVCFAAPALGSDLALPKPTVSNPPDYFKHSTNTKADIEEYLKVYQQELARSTLITVFSYFEGYIKDVLEEIITFHGGKQAFAKMARDRVTKFINVVDSNILKEKRKLQDNPTVTKAAKYRKFAKLLDGKGFKFPTELFAHFGVRQLQTKLEKRRGLQASEILSVLEDCLLFPITSVDRKHFEDTRILRNRIAHGRAPSLILKASLSDSSRLHSFAARIDRHIREHF